MSYNNNIPQLTDTTLKSQQQIRSNFQTIATVFANNHVPLTDTDDAFEGMHRVLTLRPQGGDPATSAIQTAIYNKIISSIPQMFFRPRNSQTPIQLTYTSLDTTPTNARQYSFVAGPFVIYGGKITNPTNGQTIVLTPTTTLRYVGLIAADVKGTGLAIASVIPTNITGSQFDISFETAPGSTRDVYYIAIGQ